VKGARIFIVTGHRPAMNKLLGAKYAQILPAVQALAKRTYRRSYKPTHGIPNTIFVVFRGVENVYARQNLKIDFLTITVLSRAMCLRK
jgi:hypothetical protein